MSKLVHTLCTAAAVCLLGVAMTASSASAATPPNPGLQYFGGPVMPSLHAYTVFWEPRSNRTTSTYKNVVDGFLSNVAADSGQQTNVFGIGAQYGDREGNVAAYKATFDGRILDTDPYPASACTAPGRATCLTDIQIVTELHRVIAGNPAALGTMYFVFLPRNVAACAFSGLYDGCTFGSKPVCGWHWWDTSASGTLIYAVIPFPQRGCDNHGQRPNGSVADASVSTVSHEAMEAMTDPLATRPTGQAWHDATTSGFEIGDLCEGKYGAALGGTSGRLYNQVINGGHYFVQSEWSDRQGGCVLRPPTSGLMPPQAAFTITPDSVSSGQSVSFDASGSSDAGASITSYSWDFGDGSSASGITTSHSYTTPGTYTVALTITDDDNLIGAVSHTVTVGSGASETPNIGAGTFHSCAVLSGGGVGCWGRDDFAQLGDGQMTCSSCANPSPVPVNGVTQATAVSGGVGHTCVLLTGGTVACWGENGSGQTGRAPGDVVFAPSVVNGISQATAISTGAFHSCALIADGKIECWGDDSQGQLGNGTTSCTGCGSGQPAQVLSIANATAVSAGTGSYDTCALGSDGTVACWGDNQYGQLGNGTTVSSATPVQVSGISNAVAIAAGAQHACALGSDGTVACWGDNQYGQLGNGTTVSSATPVQVSGISNAVAITAGYRHTCALLRDGTIECWGDDSYGQLGNGQLGGGVQSSTPVTAALLAPAVKIADGGYHTCVVLSDATVQCWGRGGFGQLGNGSTSDSATPVPVGPIP